MLNVPLRRPRSDCSATSLRHTLHTTQFPNLGDQTKGKHMSAEDKIKAAADKVSGQVKETVGKMTDNDKLVAEGKADKVKGEAKGAVEDVKDAFKK